MIENCCKWYFGEEYGCDDGPNDALAENFNSKPIVSLIRESIQNSLDAVDPSLNKPVKMIYEFGHLPLNQVPNLKEIRNHIQGCLDLYPNNENAKEYFPPMLSYLDNMSNHIGYIKVSDYNTIGMNYIDERKTKEPFYAFVRSKGVTAKNKTGSGGSFGFGKAAYFGMSQIKTLLVSTRTNLGKVFFEGVASLCTHLLKDQKRCAVGFYDNNNGKPINTECQIPNVFLRDSNTPGTDFWILGYNTRRKDKDIKEMIEATLRNFWLAIYEGTLEVTIDGQEITKLNLHQILQEVFNEEIDTAKWREKYNPRPYYEAVIHGKEQSAQFKYICTNLEHLGEVKLYAYLTREGSNKIMLTRKPKMLVQLKSVSPIGINAVFTCDNEQGNQLLQKMENPAHNSWSATRKKDVSIAYKEMENFILDSINKLRPQSGKKNIQIMGLSDLTWIPENLLNEEDDKENEEETLLNGNKSSSNHKETDKENGCQVSKLISVITSTKKPSKATIIEHQAGLPLDENENNIVMSFSGSGAPSDASSKEKGGQGGSNPGDGNGSNPGENEGNGSCNSGSSNVNENKSQIVSCRYKQYALKEGNKVVHHLCIDAPKDVKNGCLLVFVNTDDGFIKSPIKSAILEISKKELAIKDHIISNISLTKGYNKISVEFFDKIKHSLKLELDENR